MKKAKAPALSAFVNSPNYNEWCNGGKTKRMVRAVGYIHLRNMGKGYFETWESTEADINLRNAGR